MNGPSKGRASELPCGPLKGITVIDASNIIAGPTASKLLADYGAEVIKLEHPRLGDPLREFGYKKEGVPLWWKVLNRNKKAVTLDLSQPAGQELLKEMIGRADVFIESYRPGKMAEWGLGYDSLSAVNPGLVMLDISGYGQDGPYGRKPGFGTIAEAMSGFSYVNGFPDKPPLMPTNPLADSVTGLYGAMMILFALWWRDGGEGRGRGQSIDLSLYESLFSLMDCMITDYDQLGIVQKRTGNMPENTGGPRNAYQTRDGKWMAVSANSANTIERTFKLIGLDQDPVLGDVSRVVENLPEIDRRIAEWVHSRDADQVQESFDAVGAVVGPVYSVEDILSDPQYLARDSVIRVSDPQLGALRMQGLVARFSRTPGFVAYAGQEKGESNEAVFRDWLGRSDQELEWLREKGVL